MVGFAKSMVLGGPNFKDRSFFVSIRVPSFMEKA